MIVSLLAVFLGVAYAPWMASFTETVERRNPALTATGLAVWGLVIRIVIAVSVFFVPHVVNTVTTLVEKGASVQGALDDPALTADQRAVVQGSRGRSDHRAEGAVASGEVQDAARDGGQDRRRRPRQRWRRTRTTSRHRSRR